MGLLGVGLVTVGAILLIIILILYLAISIITYTPLTFSSAVILADEDVFLEYRDKVRELDEEFNQRVADIMQELREAERYTDCGEPECVRSDAFYNGGIDTDGKYKEGRIIKFTDLTLTTDQDGNPIIKTDWQSVFSFGGS